MSNFRVRAFYIKANGVAETAHNSKFSNREKAEKDFDSFVRGNSTAAAVRRVSRWHNIIEYSNGDKYDVELDVL